jgi:hypothetical protein
MRTGREAITDSRSRGSEGSRDFFFRPLGSVEVTEGRVIEKRFYSSRSFRLRSPVTIDIILSIWVGKRDFLGEQCAGPQVDKLEDKKRKIVARSIWDEEWYYCKLIAKTGGFKNCNQRGQ